MDRRGALAALLAIGALPLGAPGQQRGDTYHVGVLFKGGSDTMEPHREVVRQQLGRQGFVEGRNLTMTWRGGSDVSLNDRETARDLVAASPDAILAFSSAMTRAVQSATTSIPIVFAHVSDPISDGIVSDYAHPGGNTTGVSTHHRELLAKRFELLHELVPGAKRVALIAPYTLTDPSYMASEATIEQASAQLRLELVVVQHNRLWEIAERRAEAMIVYSVLGERLTTDYLIEMAARLRIPSIFPDGESAARGGLASYGTDPLEDTRLAAEILGRVLAGAKPGDQPVYRNSRFLLTINVATARTLGIRIPPALLARADRLIQ